MKGSIFRPGFGRAHSINGPQRAHPATGDMLSVREGRALAKQGKPVYPLKGRKKKPDDALTRALSACPTARARARVLAEWKMRGLSPRTLETDQDVFLEVLW